MIGIWLCVIKFSRVHDIPEESEAQITEKTHIKTNFS